MSHFANFYSNELRGLRYFQPWELLFRGAGNVWAKNNTAPPEKFWPNIIAAARMADEIRHRFGRPVTVLSAYRSPAYNKSIGGAGASKHLKFEALDIAPAGGDMRKFQRIAKQVRDERGHGGLGIYDTFVHIDGRNYLANW